jgi:hypothetical protein
VKKGSNKDPYINERVEQGKTLKLLKNKAQIRYADSSTANP